MKHVIAIQIDLIDETAVFYGQVEAPGIAEALGKALATFKAANIEGIRNVAGWDEDLDNCNISCLQQALEREACNQSCHKEAK